MISGLEFSKRCNWVIDPRYPDRQPFQYWNAKDKDWVFINGDYLHLFAPTMRMKRFVFVIHNTDKPFRQHELDKLMLHAYHIFAINTTIEHPMLTTIPLGFVDRQLPLLQAFKPSQGERDIEIYANFTTTTNSAKRRECIDAFKDNTAAVFRAGLEVPEYLSDLCRSKFVLCPEGTGMDTHRVYESLLCGAIPVVVRNPLSRLYEKLPVCILSKWTDELYVPGGTFSVHCPSYLTANVSN
jgi:hypothetical protein